MFGRAGTAKLSTREGEAVAGEPCRLPGFNALAGEQAAAKRARPAVSVTAGGPAARSPLQSIGEAVAQGLSARCSRERQAALRGHDSGREPVPLRM